MSNLHVQIRTDIDHSCSPPIVKQIEIRNGLQLIKSFDRLAAEGFISDLNLALEELGDAPSTVQAEIQDDEEPF